MAITKKRVFIYYKELLYLVLKQNELYLIFCVSRMHCNIYSMTVIYLSCEQVKFLINEENY